jgi:hypothetical protein
MHIGRCVQRRFVVATTAAGLLALGAGSASADESPAGTAARSAVGEVTSVTDAAHGATRNVAKNGEKTGNGAREDAERAITHVTQEAGEAVSKAPSAPTNKDLGALSRIPAQAAPSSAPGLPEDLVIEVPELIPGVPSIGIIPSSIPALPITPTVPVI